MFYPGYFILDISSWILHVAVYNNFSLIACDTVSQGLSANAPASARCYRLTPSSTGYQQNSGSLYKV